jgi:hypothetical protein
MEVSPGSARRPPSKRGTGEPEAVRGAAGAVRAEIADPVGGDGLDEVQATTVTNMASVPKTPGYPSRAAAFFTRSAPRAAKSCEPHGRSDVRELQGPHSRPSLAGGAATLSRRPPTQAYVPRLGAVPMTPRQSAAPGNGPRLSVNSGRSPIAERMRAFDLPSSAERDSLLTILREEETVLLVPSKARLHSGGPPCRGDRRQRTATWRR